MDTKRKLTKPIPATFFSFVFLLLTNGLFAQEDRKEAYKEMEYEQEKGEREEYALTHLRNKWELSAGYGRWYFSGASKSENPDEPFYLPNMGIWIFSSAWHFHERFSANFTIGLQISTDVPANPGLLGIILGDSINIEGSGGGFIPIELGLKYGYTGRRFMPYIQVGVGVVFGKSQYTKVEGDIFSKINRTDIKLNAAAPLAGVAVGMDYRFSNHFMLGLDLKYNHSGKFDSFIGGYERYSGLAASIKGIFIL
jgi:opacity protein-like surface antigen